MRATAGLFRKLLIACIALIVSISCNKTESKENTSKQFTPPELVEKNFIPKHHVFGDSLLLVWTKTQIDTFRSNFTVVDNERIATESYSYIGFYKHFGFHLISTEDWDGFRSGIWISHSTGKKFFYSAQPIFTTDSLHFLSFSNENFPMTPSHIAVLELTSKEIVQHQFIESSEWYPTTVKWTSDTSFSFIKVREVDNETIETKIHLSINGDTIYHRTRF